MPTDLRTPRQLLPSQPLTPLQGVHQALEAVGRGDDVDPTSLSPEVYAELRKVARAILSRAPREQTLRTTALVHECYVRLLESVERATTFDTRRRFYAFAARVMRSVCADDARRRGAHKRGAGRQRVSLECAEELLPMRELDSLDLHEALNELERVEPRLARVVIYRFFGGLGNHDIAELLDLSVASVERAWRAARLWLYRQLGPDRVSEDARA